MATKMDYELAKELKAAGFPQNYHGTGNWFDDASGEPSPAMLLSSRIDHDLSKCSYVPALSELIAACGKDFMLLERMRAPNAEGEFWAQSDNHGMAGIDPEEAVARLWLALNKK